MGSKAGFRITTIHAFTALDDDEEEGLCAMLTPSGWMPMVAGDEVRLGVLRPMAAEIAKATGRPVYEKEYALVGEGTMFEP